MKIDDGGKPVLRVRLNTHKHVTREPRPGDRWDGGEYELALIGVVVYADMANIKYDTGDSNKFYPPWTTVAVLIEEFSHGSTFLQVSHDYSVKGVYPTRQKAINATKNKKKTDGYFDRHISWRVVEVIVQPRREEIY